MASAFTTVAIPRISTYSENCGIFQEPDVGRRKAQIPTKRRAQEIWQGTVTRWWKTIKTGRTWLCISTFLHFYISAFSHFFLAVSRDFAFSLRIGSIYIAAGGIFASLILIRLLLSHAPDKFCLCANLQASYLPVSA